MAEPGNLPKYSCCHKFHPDLNEPCSVVGPGELRKVYRRSSRLQPSPSSSSVLATFEGTPDSAASQERWALAKRTPETRMSLGGRKSISKSREILSLIDPEQPDTQEGSKGMLTRSMKRKLFSVGTCETVMKKMKTERFPSSNGFDRQLRGTSTRRSGKVGKGVELDRVQPDPSRLEKDESVIEEDLWVVERFLRDTKYAATVCNKSEVESLLLTSRKIIQIFSH